MFGKLCERVEDMIDGCSSSMYPEPSSSWMSCIGPVELYLAVGGMECLRVGKLVIAVPESFLPTRCVSLMVTPAMLMSRVRYDLCCINPVISSRSVIIFFFIASISSLPKRLSLYVTELGLYCRHAILNCYRISCLSLELGLLWQLTHRLSICKTGSFFLRSD